MNKIVKNTTMNFSKIFYMIHIYIRKVTQNVNGKFEKLQCIISNESKE